MGWDGFFAFFPSFPVCFPQVPKRFPRFYPIYFARSSTPRVHVSFYFATWGARRCFRWGVLNLPEKFADGPMNMAFSKKLNDHAPELIYESSIRIVRYIVIDINYLVVPHKSNFLFCHELFSLAHHKK